jgi:hypothetical protein
MYIKRKRQIPRKPVRIRNALSPRGIKDDENSSTVIQKAVKERLPPGTFLRRIFQYRKRRLCKNIQKLECSGISPPPFQFPLNAIPPEQVLYHHDA